MPSVDENLKKWHQEPWPDDGEWSRAWGGATPQWRTSIRPRIARYLPTGTLLELAPGHGRFTQFLLAECKRLVVVDLSASCIDACKRRFADAPTPIDYHVNDGYTLDAIADGSIDFAFSFDSLVHAEVDVMQAYVEQLARKLSANGTAFLHHSNTGAYPHRTALAHALPFALRRRLQRRTGILPDLEAWRAESVTAQAVADACRRAGLRVLKQELVAWHASACLVDCFTTFTRSATLQPETPALVRNPAFMQEARRAQRDTQLK